MRLEIQERQRAQSARLPHGRRQQQRALVHSPGYQMQPHVQYGCAATTTLEMRRERLHQPAKHEREWFQTLDRPLEIDSLFEALFRYLREQRPWICPTRKPLPPGPLLSEPRCNLVWRQCRHLSERAHTPATNGRKEVVRNVRIVRDVRDVRNVLVVREVREHCSRQVSECAGFLAWLDDGQGPAGSMREQASGGARAGYGETDAQSAIGGGPTECLAHRARIPKQTRQATEIDRDLSRTVHFDARRELVRDLPQDLGRAPLRRVHNAKHRGIIQPYWRSVRLQPDRARSA